MGPILNSSFPIHPLVYKDVFSSQFCPYFFFPPLVQICPPDHLPSLPASLLLSLLQFVLPSSMSFDCQLSDCQIVRFLSRSSPFISRSFKMLVRICLSPCSFSRLYISLLIQISTNAHRILVTMEEIVMIKSVDMCVIVLRDIPANTATQVMLCGGLALFLSVGSRREHPSLQHGQGNGMALNESNRFCKHDTMSLTMVIIKPFGAFSLDSYIIIQCEILGWVLALGAPFCRRDMFVSPLWRTNYFVSTNE